MPNDPIQWRGFTLPPSTDGESYLLCDHILIRALRNDDGTWRAAIEVGDLSGVCDVAIDAQSALETALVDLKKELTRHYELIGDAFP